MNLPDSTTIISRDNIQVLRIENRYASAQISLFGGHILSFTPKHDGRERLWLSDKAVFDGKKPIRGGVPICWPWFGPHPSKQALPAHGYARSQNWQIDKIEESETATHISLKPKTSTGDGFEGKAQLSLVVKIGQQLNIQLHTRNLGDKAFSFNCALHSYLSVANINQTEVIGLSGQYLDKTQSHKTLETPTPYKISQETDRVHLQKPRTLMIKDNVAQIKIDSSGHDSIVVWNPWRDKSMNLSDMGENSYLSMLCLETAITQGQLVNAGNTHVLEQIIT